MNNELIIISYDSEQPTVLGRDLHEALEVKEKYADWFKRMCSYGFEENTDYRSFSEKSEKPTGGRPTTDHQSTSNKKIIREHKNDVIQRGAQNNGKRKNQDKQRSKDESPDQHG